MADMQCTGWLDGIPQWLGGTGDEWLRCCIDHDQRLKSAAADAALGACVRASEAMLFGTLDISAVMGWIMQWGVQTLGVIFVFLTGGLAAFDTARTRRIRNLSKRSLNDD